MVSMLLKRIVTDSELLYKYFCHDEGRIYQEETIKQMLPRTCGTGTTFCWTKFINGTDFRTLFAIDAQVLNGKALLGCLYKYEGNGLPDFLILFATDSVLIYKCFHVGFRIN